MEHHVVTVTMHDDFFTTASSRGMKWYADLPEKDGGTDKAPTPEELVMGTLGSCMAQTARLYANHKGWQIDRIQIKLDFERFKGGDYDGYDGDAAIVHEIREAITIEGPLDDEQLTRIKGIMGKCPIRRLIANPAFFVEKAFEPET